MPILTSAFLATASLGGSPQPSDPTTWSVPVKIEESGGYAANPSTLSLPLRQDWGTVEIQRLETGHHRVTLQGKATPLVLPDVDLGLLVPRLPAYARADKDLAAYALLQREFNRNEVKFGPTGEMADFKIANNCLRSGLWEVMLDTKLESGNALTFHGWFPFPAEEYGRLFEAQTGLAFQECRQLVAQYPTIDGMPAPLEKLRQVVSEQELVVENLTGEAPIQFGEQKRKAKLLLTSGIATYADFTASAKQPIQTARFSEPGFYDPANPVRFDLGWLAKPQGAVRREVQVGGEVATEVEIAFAGGRRLIVADRDLARLPRRDAAPDNDKDTLRVTFGIGTPDIYATLSERSAEQAAQRPSWLFLLGPDGKHVDNHQAGVDRVFLWNEGDRKLHLYLVGYERITVVAHLALPLTNG